MARVSYPEFMMPNIKRSTSADMDNRILHKEWDEISCAICMDHPHNAVLLVCSSHEKGCKSYICDTSYRHSNCLDRFKNYRDIPLPSPHFPGNPENSGHGRMPLGFHTPEPIFSRHGIRGDLTGTHVAHDVQESSSGISRGIFEAVEEETHGQEAEMFLEIEGHERMDLQDFDGESSTSEKTEKKITLRCPLCRGAILGYRIEGEVRHYVDQKPRSCSRESCTFTGNYRELRKHARRAHPTTRPADVNPLRQLAWRHLEREQEIGDVISAVQSTSPGAFVIGDYVIDGGDGLSNDPENNVPRSGSRPWWNTLLLLQMFQEPRSLTRPLRTRRRRAAHRNMLDVDILAPEDDENNNWCLDSNEVPAPQRRRVTRFRTYDDSRERETF